jgi:tetratricopeptide (TPR) repeat protein
MGIFDSLFFKEEKSAPVRNLDKEKAQELVNESKLLILSEGSNLDAYTKKALPLVNRAIELDPESADAWGSKAAILMMRPERIKGSHNEDEDKEALLCLDRALELDKADGSSWYHKGQLLQSGGRYEEALECFNTALGCSLNPLSKNMILMGKGQTLEALGRNTEALSVYDKIPTADSDYRNAAEHKAGIYEKMGKIEEAFNWYSGAAYAHHKHKDFEKSRICLDHCLRLKPMEKLILYTKGTLLMEISKSSQDLSSLEEAYRCFELVLKQEPENATYLNSSGVCLFQMKRYDEGLEIYNRALRLNPKNDLVLTNKAYGLIKMKRYAEALACLEEVIRIKPGAYETWIQCGLIHRDLGMFEEALRDADQIFKIIGDTPMPREFWIESLKFRIDILKKLGRDKEAAKSEEKMKEIMESRFSTRPFSVRG